MVRLIKKDFINFNILSLFVTRITVIQASPYFLLARKEVLDKIN